MQSDSWNNSGALARVAAVNAWLGSLNGPGAAPDPPAHWAVRGAASLEPRSSWAPIARGRTKLVYHTQLRRPDPATPSVVVKTCVVNGAEAGNNSGAPTHAPTAAATAPAARGLFNSSQPPAPRHTGAELPSDAREVLLLEYLQGLPGIPTLLGGWCDDAGGVSWAVTGRGPAIGLDSGIGSGGLLTRPRLQPAYEVLAREQPSALADASESGPGVIPLAPQLLSSAPTGALASHAGWIRSRRQSCGGAGWVPWEASF